MHTTTLADKQIGATGYGLMGLTWVDKPPPQEQAFAAMKAALKSGANFWNGGELYGPPNANSLQLLHAYFTQNPQDAEKVVISIKGGLDPVSHRPDGSPQNVRRSVDECLRVLGSSKTLDIFECARIDARVPIEDTIETLAEYVEAGKLGGISLSECSAETIRRAAKVHKIAAVEVEFSMFSTDILENGVAKACAELGIPVVAYSPFSRGFLTGRIKKRADIPEGDWRLVAPRFQPGALEENLKLVDEVEKLAKKKDVTPGQVALGWIMAQSKKNGNPEFIPIPGATTAARVEENGVSVELTDDDMKELSAIIERCTVAGARYPAGHPDFGDSPKRS